MSRTDTDRAVRRANGDVGYSALVAGAMLLPLFIPLAVLAPVTGRITSKTGPRPPMPGGLLLGAAGGAPRTRRTRSNRSAMAASK